MGADFAPRHAAQDLNAAVGPREGPARIGRRPIFLEIWSSSDENTSKHSTQTSLADFLGSVTPEIGP
jgi:hypothetical protein